MGNWYKVAKRIHNRLYDYWQRTERHGKQVKTFNKYIGPTTTLVKGQPIPGYRTMTKSQRYNTNLHRIFHDAEILNRQYDALRDVQVITSANASNAATDHKYIIWERKDDCDYFKGQTFTPEEAREQLATVYHYDAMDEGESVDTMDLSQLLNEDWELRPVPKTPNTKQE